MGIDLVCADVLAWAAEYRGPKFHSLLCDPPYHLTNAQKDIQTCPECGRMMGGRDGKRDDCPRCGAQLSYLRSRDAMGGGFMGKAWDGGDIAFRPETWAALGEHLLPGAFGMAFASSRGWHRMACAIEDAGFIFHPSIFLLGWNTGQGFPKAQRVNRTACEDGSSPFCKCGDSQRLFPGHDFRDNGHGEMSTSVGSPGDCPECRHSDDGLLRRDTERAQDSEPLPSDAQAHTHSAVPFPETHGGNEPSHTPSQAQYSALHASTDSSLPSVLRRASQDSQVKRDETYRAGGSILANGHGNRTGGYQKQGTSECDTSADRMYGTCSSGDTSRVGSSAMPFIGSRYHDTTTGKLCQVCGKPIDPFGGHRYGLQALKPSLEPIIVFQRPYEGRPVDCITATGAGALWVDGGRIPTGGDNLARNNRPGDNGWKNASGGPNRAATDSIAAAARWPANFILGDDAAAEALDRQSGVDNSVFLQHNVEEWRCQLCGEESSEAASMYAGRNTASRNGNLPTDGYGNRLTGLSPMAMKFITRTQTNSITICQTCNSLLRNGTTTIISGLEKTIRQLRALNTDDANVAESIGRLIASQEERLALITAIANGARVNISANGKPSTPDIPLSTCRSGDPSIRNMPLNTHENGGQGPSRFFYRVSAALDDAEPVRYCAKASRRERDAGLEAMPVKHATCRPLSDDEDDRTIQERLHGRLARNHHPCCKPLDLCRYLATLLLPPAEYAPRRILVPFAGVGSEMIGASLAGWEDILGIEQDAEYCELGRARIAHWCSQPALLEVAT